MRRFTDFSGARPAHLLVLLPCLALAAYAAAFLLGDPASPTILTWFAGAVLAHDFVLFPLYTGTDRVLRLLPVRIINYVRLPLLGAGLTFVMFLPGIIRQGTVTHLAATSLSQQPYLGRWLWLVVALFAASGLAYLLRVVTTHARAKTSARPPIDRT
ncbi:MAG TPA: hypothetical protein VFG87_14195 [Amycolatopsis sp.]|jgi:hypothetical protein|nr:hypothetical protein [Amycolatopsis sp.]